MQSASDSETQRMRFLYCFHLHWSKNANESSSGLYFLLLLLLFGQLENLILEADANVWFKTTNCFFFVITAEINIALFQEQNNKPHFFFHLVNNKIVSVCTNDFVYKIESTHLFVCVCGLSHSFGFNCWMCFSGVFVMMVDCLSVWYTLFSEIIRGIEFFHMVK